MKKFKNIKTYGEETTHYEDILFDLENKLIRANKKIKDWKFSSDMYEGLYLSMNDTFTEYYIRWAESERKQKKAWIAFYIATILYIVGIVIII